MRLTSKSAPGSGMTLDFGAIDDNPGLGKFILERQGHCLIYHSSDWPNINVPKFKVHM